jgi:hypothetical protein
MLFNAQEGLLYCRLPGCEIAFNIVLLPRSLLLRGSFFAGHTGFYSPDLQQIPLFS